MITDKVIIQSLAGTVHELSDKLRASKESFDKVCADRDFIMERETESREANALLREALKDAARMEGKNYATYCALQGEMADVQEENDGLRAKLADVRQRTQKAFDAMYSRAIAAECALDVAQGQARMNGGAVAEMMAERDSARRDLARTKAQMREACDRLQSSVSHWDLI